MSRWLSNGYQSRAVEGVHSGKHPVHHFFGAQIPVGQMAAMPLVQIWQGRAGQGLGRERTNLSISSRSGEGGGSRLAILQLQPQQQRRDIGWAHTR